MQPGRPPRGAAPAPSPALSAALAGAVDLSALRARTEARERAEAQAQEQARSSQDGTAPAAPVTVLDVTEATFQAEVLDRSFQVPVVLDLWAEWCGPCKQLSPVLERLAVEGGGSWVLAKVDVDANPALAQGLRVQGIPAVKAVWQGQLVAEFSGAIPEEQARQFVTELVRATTGGGLEGGDAEEPVAEDARLDAAEAALERGDLVAAEAAYQAILDAEPDHPEASLALRQVQLFRRADEAGPHALAAAGAPPGDVAAQTRAPDLLLGTRHIEAAFDRLLDVVRRSAGEERDTARKHLVELFAVVGDDDPRVGTARRQLTAALF